MKQSWNNLSGSPDGKKKLRNIAIATSASVVFIVWGGSTAWYLSKPSAQKKKEVTKKIKKPLEEQKQKELFEEAKLKHSRILDGEIEDRVGMDLGPAPPSKSTEKEFEKKDTSVTTRGTETPPAISPKTPRPQTIMRAWVVTMNGSPESIKQLSELLLKTFPQTKETGGEKKDAFTQTEPLRTKKEVKDTWPSKEASPPGRESPNWHRPKSLRFGR